jgi:type IV pilus biogenesis protein CpaD/CtpE
MSHRGSIDWKLDRILARFTILENFMSAEFDALTAQVQANADAENSALILINGIAARITAAGVDPAKLSALTAELKASGDALSAAVVANTPAA